MGRESDARLTGDGIEVLKPLALPNGIEREHDEPLVDEVQDHHLVGRSPKRVAAAIENRGSRPIQFVRQEEHCRDEKRRLRFIDDLLTR